jgi:hypothetical protein
MASLSSDSGRMQRRDSSDRSAGIRRPRLLRASATEVSITTSNASRNALATQPGRRATELLSRVAFVSGSPPDSVLRSTSLLSSRTPMFDSVDRQSSLSTSPVSQPDAFLDMHPHQCTSPRRAVEYRTQLTLNTVSKRYVSFPSFDLYEAREQDEEKETETKSP